jgi:hypothetical protein
MYGGGVGGVGVETPPTVYLVLWGYGRYGDPSGMGAILKNFLSSVSGSGWLHTADQYCQGVPSGTINCGSSGQHASTVFNLAGVWSDDTSVLPTHPTMLAMAAEVARAAAHFGRTLGSNTQYVIASAHSHGPAGFGTQFCAYHADTNWTVALPATAYVAARPDRGRDLLQVRVHLSPDRRLR